jgi:hypothetical protein
VTEVTKKKDGILLGAEEFNDNDIFFVIIPLFSSPFASFNAKSTQVLNAFIS